MHVSEVPGSNGFFRGDFRLNTTLSLGLAYAGTGLLGFAVGSAVLALRGR